MLDQLFDKDSDDSGSNSGGEDGPGKHSGPHSLERGGTSGIFIDCKFVLHTIPCNFLTGFRSQAVAYSVSVLRMSVVQFISGFF